MLFSNVVIFTPCSRLEFLPRIKDSIKVARQKSKIDLQWYIYVDTSVISDENLSYVYTRFKDTPWIHVEHHDKPEGAFLGNHLKNICLNKMPRPYWMYVLDDDNLLHKELFTSIPFFEGVLGYTFKQLLTDDSVRAGNKIEIGEIDQAQYLLHTDIIGDIVYEQSYISDGRIIMDIFERSSDSMMYIDKVLSYYNRCLKGN